MLFDVDLKLGRIEAETPERAAVKALEAAHGRVLRFDVWDARIYQEGEVDYPAYFRVVLQGKPRAAA
jgi:hypothetical protein